MKAKTSRSNSADLPLSVAIITHNEEARLSECLESVSFADEVVVVDAESTDATVAVAEKSGARVLVESWKGFGPQKQSAVDHCRNKWVLVLDADERVPPATAREIRSLLSSDNDITAYSFPRKNYFWGKWIRHAGWWPDRTIRLVQKELWRIDGRVVHEAFTGHGPVSDLDVFLVHYPFKNLEHIVTKINQYSSLGAQELDKKGVLGSTTKAATRGCWAFFNNLILRRGFQDGGEGLVLAILDAMNTFLKYLKLKEIQSRKGK